MALLLHSHDDDGGIGCKLAAERRPAQCSISKDSGLEIDPRTLKFKPFCQEPSPASAVYAESLGMLAAIEISRMQNSGRDLHVHQAGQLSPGHERLVREYISENLHREISLSDLAGLVQIKLITPSQAHFSKKQFRPAAS